MTTDETIRLRLVIEPSCRLGQLAHKYTSMYVRTFNTYKRVRSPISLPLRLLLLSRPRTRNDEQEYYVCLLCIDVRGSVFIRLLPDVHCCMQVAVRLLSLAMYVCCWLRAQRLPLSIRPTTYVSTSATV